MTILAQSLLALVSSHLVALLLLSVWHNSRILLKCDYFIFSIKLFAGLNEGKS
jgi:hypothetical protein